MNGCKFLRLTEVSKKKRGDEALTDTPCLINVEGIVNIIQNELEKDDVPIIGAKKEDNILRVVMLVTGRTLFVRESLDEMEAMVKALQEW